MRTDPAHDALHKLELTISHLLRVGVLLAGIFLLVGWLWLWLNNGSMLQSFTVYESKTLVETIHWALITNDRAMMVSIIGLALLVCLPIIRVLLTAILFIKQKDFILAFLALAVFISLVASFFLGIDL